MLSFNEKQNILDVWNDIGEVLGYNEFYSDVTNPQRQTAVQYGETEMQHGNVPEATSMATQEELIAWATHAPWRAIEQAVIPKPKRKVVERRPVHPIDVWSSYDGVSRDDIAHAIADELGVYCDMSLHDITNIHNIY